jgi:hypothetical protein
MPVQVLHGVGAPRLLIAVEDWYPRARQASAETFSFLTGFAMLRAAR